MAKKNFIKSTSTFLKRKMHQPVNDGTIFERDWVTIGGVDHFLPGETPLYQNGNFIITVNDDIPAAKEFASEDYEKIGSGDVWTLEAIETNKKQDDSGTIINNQMKIPIYNVTDFAYFGSFEELVRGSITDVLNMYPGEIYLSDQVVYVTVNNEVTQLSVEGFSQVALNPFNINIIQKQVVNPDNSLRYFANEGYKNYEVIAEDADTGDEVITWTVTNRNECVAISGHPDYEVKVLADISIGKSIKLKYVRAEGQNYLLHDGSKSGYHIRPKKEFLIRFYDSLEGFEYAIMNPNSEPRHTLKLNVIQETDYGYRTVLQTFTFPTAEGGYNIGGSAENFTPYVNRLMTIADLYDSNFSDNIYRMLTHETLKNYDFTRYKDNPNEDSYEEGQEKLKAILRLYGMEFDKIKGDIANIKGGLTVSYEEPTQAQIDNLPNFVENEGFQAINIAPYKVNGKKDCPEFTKDFAHTVHPFQDEFQYYYFGNTAANISVQNPPNEGMYHQVTGSGGSITYMQPVFKKYHSSNQFDANYVNKEFLKRLRMNSKYILRRKGTIAGLEMILAMFGIASKRMIDRMDSNVKNRLNFSRHSVEPAYTVSEYQYSGIAPIEEGSAKANTIRYLNSIKVFEFDYDESNPYAGLPIKELKNDVDGTTLLYPSYNTSETYDGDLYYQMNGGWINYRFNVFNKNGCQVNGGYTCTMRNVRMVDSLEQLLDIAQNELYNGLIVKVLNTKPMVAIKDSWYYSVNYETINTVAKPYIWATVRNGMFSLGNSDYSELETIDECGTHITYVSSAMTNGDSIKFFYEDGTEVNFQYKPGTNSDDDSGYYKYEGTDDNSYTDWKRMSEPDVSLLDKITTVMEGNNPHYGKPSYDGGVEFIERMKDPFRYSFEHDLFDMSCFGSEAQYQQYKQRYLAGEEAIIFEGFDGPEVYTDLEGNGFPAEENGVWPGEGPDEEEETYFKQLEKIYQTFPSKRIDLKFGKPGELPNVAGEDGDASRKYFLSTVMKYAEEFIPSTAMVEVKKGY